MLGVGAPEVRTRAGAEVSVVAFGLVDPPPAEVPLEVDEECPQAAVVLDVPEEGGGGGKQMGTERCPNERPIVAGCGIGSGKPRSIAVCIRWKVV